MLQIWNWFFIVAYYYTFVRYYQSISAISGNSEIPGNPGKYRKTFSGKIPGNFPPDLHTFLVDATHDTALILSFKKLKIKAISGNFGRKFSGNSGKFSPKTSRNFLRNFLRFLIGTYVTALILFFKNIKMYGISGNFGGKFRENFRKFLRRVILGENFPGKFPPDFPGFSGEKTHVTALNLSF